MVKSSRPAGWRRQRPQHHRLRPDHVLDQNFSPMPSRDSDFSPPDHSVKVHAVGNQITGIPGFRTDFLESVEFELFFAPTTR